MSVKYITISKTDFMVCAERETSFGGKAGRLYLYPSLLEDMRVAFGSPTTLWYYICMILYSLNSTDHLIPYDTKFLAMKFGGKKEDVDATVAYCAKQNLLKIIEKQAPVLFERKKEFERVWASFKYGGYKPRCWKIFLRTVKEAKDYRDIHIALANYFNANFHVKTRRLRRSEKYFQSIHQKGLKKGEYKSLGLAGKTHTPLFFFKHWRKLVNDKKTHKKPAIAAANRIRSLGWCKSRDYARKAMIAYKKEHVIK